MRKIVNFIKSKLFKNKEEIKSIKSILKKIKKDNMVEAHKELINLINKVEKLFPTLNYKKIVININHYGFGLSDKAMEMISQLKGIEINEGNQFNISRDDPYLVYVVESLRLDANDNYSKLAIVKVPYEIEYEIRNIKGNEKIYIYGQDYTNKLLK